MEDRNFSFFKTLYLTRRNVYELPDERKGHLKETRRYHSDFVSGEIELGKRYRVEIFDISEPWKLEINDYLHFIEVHKENLIGAQISSVEFFNFDDYVSWIKTAFNHNLKEENENLWIDSSKYRWVPQIDLFGIPFYFWLGFINPDLDADQNCVFLFYSFEEGTENLYEKRPVEFE